MKNIVLFALVLYLTTACAPVYTPNLVNTPFFAQQHDAQLQGSIGLSGYDVQAAFSPLNNLGLMGNTTFYDSDNGNYSSRFFEGGAGYYQTLDKNGRIECYGGFGYGHTELNKTLLADRINAQYTRFFIQPGICAKQDIFEGSFSTRISYVDLFSLKSSDPGLGPVNAVFIEPVLTGKIGFKYIKYFTQFGLSMHTRDVLSLYSLPLILNFGINFNFSKLYFKKDVVKQE